MEQFYVFYGKDKTLIQVELEKLLKRLQIEEVIRYDMSFSSLLDVVEDASTVSMFGTKKVIILENCTFLSANKAIEHIEILENYIEHYNPNNYCIFLSYVEKLDSRKKIYKLLNKQAKIVECKKADEVFLNQYVQNYLQTEQYQIESSSYFLGRVGSNLANIQNELDKLMMYKKKEKKITNQDIDKIVIKVMEEEIFVLTDAIIARDISKSLSLLEEFLNKNYDEMQIVMLLASQFRFLFQVKRLLNKNKGEVEIAKILGANPYRVKFAVKKLYLYSEKELLNYIQRLAKIDHDVKLGKMNKRLALELFIIEK